MTSTVLLQTIDLLWQNGWQPNELVRQVGRATSREAAQLAKIAVVVDDRGREGQAKHPRWSREIERLSDRVPEIAVGDDWLARWLDGSGGDRAAQVEELLAELSSLGALPILIPPPGRPDAVSSIGDDDGDDPVLARVRALLAQAESTTFPAEAEVFTAKAQALMSRHAIDEAMLRHAAGSTDQPVSMRVPVDDPYVSEKADLLHVVADAGRCRAVFIRRYAMCVLVGDGTDLRRVELMFTSLLLQAQAALNHESAQDEAGSHRRSRRFRGAFLAGYAARIGQRLIAERDRAVAESGVDVLPVLASQSQAVDDEVARLFGNTLRSTGGRARDRAGWDAGSDAAERASLRDAGVDAGPTTGRSRLPAGDVDGI